MALIDQADATFTDGALGPTATFTMEGLRQLVDFCLAAGASYALDPAGQTYTALINHGLTAHDALDPDQVDLESLSYDICDSLLHGTALDDGQPFDRGTFRGCATPGHCA